MVDFTNYLNDYLSTNDSLNNKRPRIPSYDYDNLYSTSSETSDFFSINSNTSDFPPNKKSKCVAFDTSIKNYDGLREDLFIFLKICKNESVNVIDKNMIESLLILTKDLIQRIKEAIENNNSRVYILNGGGSNTYILKSNFDIKINELLEFETVLNNRIKTN